MSSILTGVGARDSIASKNGVYSKSIDSLFECEGMDPPMLVPIASSLRLFSNSCSKELAIPAINHIDYISTFISTTLQSITSYFTTYINFPAINHQLFHHLCQHPCNQSPIISTSQQIGVQSITTFLAFYINA